MRKEGKRRFRVELDEEEARALEEYSRRKKKSVEDLVRGIFEGIIRVDKVSEILAEVLAKEISEGWRGEISEKSIPDLEEFERAGICPIIWFMHFQKMPGEVSCEDCLDFKSGVCKGGRDPVECFRGKKPEKGFPVFGFGIEDEDFEFSCSGDCKSCDALKIFYELFFSQEEEDSVS